MPAMQQPEQRPPAPPAFAHAARQSMPSDHDVDLPELFQEDEDDHWVLNRTPAQIRSGRAQVKGGAVADAAYLRTAQQAAAAHGFPLGPLPLANRDQLKNKLVSVASNPAFGGGAWGINFGPKQEATATGSRGPTQAFWCDRQGAGEKSGLMGCNCSWCIKYEFSTEGWVLVGYQASHVARGSDANALPCHELESTLTAAMAFGSRRHIPDELTSTGELLAQSGIGAAEIQHILEQKAKNEDIDITFNYKDVYDAFPTNVAARGFDAKGLVELLAARENELGQRYFMTTDTCGFVNKVFFQLEGSLMEWSKSEQCNVLLFDPTHGTNRYGMKLCCFTTVGPTGQTVVMACALIKYEDKEDIAWAFRCFAAIYKSKPVAVFTDSAAAIEAAILDITAEGNVWAGVIHLLCVFHLSKNFWSHMRPLFATKPEIWRELNNMFWRLAKNSDATFRGPPRPVEDTGGWNDLLDPEDSEFITLMTRLEEEQVSEDTYTWATFHEAFDKLTALVEKEANGSTKEDGIAFLQKLYRSRRKWAACYTWRIITMGVHSTQRAEAIHAAIKGGCSMANWEMCRLVPSMVDYNETSRHRKEIDGVRKRIKQIGMGANCPPWISKVASKTDPKITPYANELLLSQTAQALQYNFVSTGYTVNRMDAYTATRVTAVSNLESDLESANLNAEGEQTCFDCDEDFGLVDRTSIRLTTVNMCSCQLLLCLMIPCRHIIGLRIHLQNPLCAMPMLELIGPKWKIIDVQQEAKLIQALLRKPNPLNRSYSSTPYSLTKKERFTALTHELASLAEVGSQSDEAMQLIIDAIPGLMSGPQQTRGSSQNAAAAIPPDAVIPDPAHNHPHSASSHSTTKARRTPDFVQFNQMIGTRFFVDPVMPSEPCFKSMSTEGGLMVGRWIAYKWGDLAKKGWYVGKIVKQIPFDEAALQADDTITPDNFAVWYSAEEPSAVSPLESGTYCSTLEVQANCHMGSWTMLKEPPLGHDVGAMAAAGTLHDPQVTLSRGRPQEARLKPAAGPTSSPTKRRRR